MKKGLYIIIGILLMGVSYTSCEMDDNINPKAPIVVPAGTLLTNAQIQFVNQYNSMSVNRNISRLLAQYWMETTYTNESRYNFQDRGIPDSFWSVIYRDVLMDLKKARELVEKAGYDEKKAQNMRAIITVMEVASYALLTETFGDVPYSEALLGLENTLPKYDDAATIFADLFVKLNEAINSLDVNGGSFGAEDLYFGGDISKWKMYANSLKLRMGMRMADVPSFNSQSVVESAISGIYKSQDESFIFKYLGTDPYVNTIYSGFYIDNRQDYVPSNTLIDKMNELEDPRLPLWFTKKDGKYIGLTYGKTDGGVYDNFSNFTSMFFDPALAVPMIDYVEIEFFLAEAVERGYNVGGSAEEHYNNGIKASILYYGGTDADADAYLANPKVAYATAEGNWKQKIGTQKWLAMYNRGVEGWTEWRRLDYPILNVPEGKTYADIPVRYPYPYDENDMNPDNYEAAAAAIGGDSATTKLWWDVN